MTQNQNWSNSPTRVYSPKNCYPRARMASPSCLCISSVHLQLHHRRPFINKSIFCLPGHLRPQPPKHLHHLLLHQAGHVWRCRLLYGVWRRFQWMVDSEISQSWGRHDTNVTSLGWKMASSEKASESQARLLVSCLPGDRLDKDRAWSCCEWSFAWESCWQENHKHPKQASDGHWKRSRQPTVSGLVGQPADIQRRQYLGAFSWALPWDRSKYTSSGLGPYLLEGCGLKLVAHWGVGRNNLSTASRFLQCRHSLLDNHQRKFGPL